LRLLLGMFAYVGLLLALAIVASAQDKDKDVHYGVGTWDADSYGNHRAVVRVRGSGEAVWAHLPWRRRDQNPDAKEVMVVDAKTGHRVRNVVRVAVTLSLNR